MNLFSSSFVSAPDPDAFPLPLLDSRARISISHLLDHHEIWGVISKLGSFEAPVPDGYHLFFYKKYWDTLNPDLTFFIRKIFGDKAIPESINETLIAMIPKTSYLFSITQFRPISLCNTVYKIVTKLIANRLRSFLPSRISPNQNSFLPGKGTETNVIMVNETLHSMRKRKVYRVAPVELPRVLSTS